MLFTGRVTADAEVRAIKNDKKVTNFTVALNKRWKSKDGEVHEKTAFVECAYWANAAVAEFLTKGAIVEVTGWIEARAWASGNVCKVLADPILPSTIKLLICAFENFIKLIT